MRVHRSTTLLLLGALAGCTEVMQPTALEEASFLQAAQSGPPLGKVTGGGHYLIVLGDGTEVDLQFSVSGQQTDADESARGNFHHRTELFGQTIDFHGTFTCLAIDEANGRAWIGGIVTQNRSEREPFASGEIYQPGRDIWFRVLDNGQPSEGVDRTTFVGFEGSADIPTSAEYCAQRPWPDDNARTNPLTSGNIKIHP